MIMEEIVDFIRNCKYYFIATMDGDQPRVRPFGTVDVFEGKLYIQTGKCKEVSKQISANAKVEICAFDPTGERWVRVAGTLVEDDRMEPKAHMLDCYPELKAMYAADDPNTEVLYFEDAVAVFYSFTDSPCYVKF